MTDRPSCPCSAPCTPKASARLVAVGTDLNHSIPIIESTFLETNAQASRRAGMFLLSLEAWDAASPLLAERLTKPEQHRVRVAWLDDTDTASALLMARPFDEAKARYSSTDLSDLIERRAFRCAYQPIVELADGTTLGYEALLRVDETEQTWTAGELFTTADQAGWTDVLDRIGRETAITGAGGWLDDKQLFVNFIPTSVYRPEHCLQTTWKAATAAGLDTSHITFEVTEGSDVDPAHLDHVLEVYRDAGCKIAVDDVGAGYGSLGRVARLRPDVVKLDIALVQQLPSPTAVAVTRSIVQLSHEIGATVLAEGIETEAHLDECRKLGITLGQGWLFGRPEFREATQRGKTRTSTN